MPVFKIHHITKYNYDRPVRESANQIKIYPFSHSGQETVSHELNITSDPNINGFIDYFGNKVGWFMVNEPHRELTIDSQLVIKTAQSVANPILLSTTSEWMEMKSATSVDIRLLDLAKPEPLKSQKAIKVLADELFPHNDAPALFIQRCSEHIFNNFQYKKGITSVETTVDEILEHKSGVCQDFAHVLLEMLRSEGIPARYVSGYICPNSDGVRGAGATHAWVEVWLPSSGWVGIDPTNNTWVSNLHVCLAVGRHFNDCSPVKGTFKGPARQELSVYVSVGFEDGTTFEDNNLVQMSKEPAKGVPVPDISGMQQ
jgi:transglutaminase-like putative cysteine protease